MLRLTGWGYIFVLVANWKPLFLSMSPPKHLFPCSYFRFPFRRPSWRCIIIFKCYSVQPRSHFIIITSVVIRALERGNLREKILAGGLRVASPRANISGMIPATQNKLVHPKERKSNPKLSGERNIHGVDKSPKKKEKTPLKGSCNAM